MKKNLAQLAECPFFLQIHSHPNVHYSALVIWFIRCLERGVDGVLSVECIPWKWCDDCGVWSVCL